MKRLIALVLLVAVMGTVYGGVMPQGQQSRPLLNLPLSSVYAPWLLPFLQPLLRIYAPSPRPPVYGLPPSYGRAKAGDIPVPPICNLTCRLRPVQGIVQ